MLHLFDTAEGRVVPIEPREPGKVSMYVCGPTVYGPPHLGHGRFSLVFDILRRYLEWSGNEVTYVSNVTDIDDNIIRRAAEEGRSTQEVVDHYEVIEEPGYRVIYAECPAGTVALGGGIQFSEGEYVLTPDEILGTGVEPDGTRWRASFYLSSVPMEVRMSITCAAIDAGG